MHRSILFVSLALGLPTYAAAGPNAGGSLVVHATPNTIYTTDHSGYCGLSDAGGGCEGLVTNLPSGSGSSHVWWVAAAFPPTSEPRLSGVSFGIYYDADAIIVVDWGMCGVFELPTHGWPGPDEGNGVVFGTVEQGLITDVYWFAGYEYAGRDVSFRLGIHPTLGSAGFVDNSVPAVEDPVADFGRLGFGGERGYLPCPEAMGACCQLDGSCTLQVHADCAGEWLGSSVSCDPAPCSLGACCLGDGTCRILSDIECESLGGTHEGAFTSCKPKPCAVPVGACCLADGACQISSEADCDLAGGDYVWTGTTCDPNPCALALYEVAADGSGDLPTIQAAVNAASDGSTVELLDGVYSGLGNRDVDFQGKAITVRSQNGNPELCVIDCESIDRGFRFHLGESHESTLQNVTIRGGRSSDGGGIAIQESSPSIVGCVFTECAAYNGGALYLQNSSARIDRCVFSRNSADLFGGAVYLNNYPRPSELVVFSGCDFFENTAIRNPRGFGGGMALVGGEVAIERCTLRGNVASEAGGAFGIAGYGVTRIESCTLVENRAPDSGSAIWADAFEEISIAASIVAFNLDSSVIDCSGKSIELSCCDVFGNEGGDYVDCFAGQNGIRGNISLDPMFCDRSGQDFRLRPGSPCLPKPWASISSCGLIGAHGLGCGVAAARQPGASAPLAALPEGGASTLDLVRPNPSVGGIEISMRLAAPSHVRIDLYDVFGRKIARIIDERLEPGVHTFERDILKESEESLPAGVYYVRIDDGRSTADQRIVLVR